MPFTPKQVSLREAGGDNPNDWLLTEDMSWTGQYRGSAATFTVTGSEADPFTTDLASVPRWLTWLFPRYGTYTKAAVLHDSLCRRPGGPIVRDRSDADEVFRIVMAEMGVPWARRWVMFSAVSLATLLRSIWPGRSSKRALVWIGRLLLLGGAAVVSTLSIVSVARSTGVVGPVMRVFGAAGGAIAVLVAAGYIAQGRWDRWLVYLAVVGMGVASLPLVAVGGAIGVVLIFYLLFEDMFSGFKATRTRLRRLAASTPTVAATPKEQRKAAVQAS